MWKAPYQKIFAEVGSFIIQKLVNFCQRGCTEGKDKTCSNIIVISLVQKHT